MKILVNSAEPDQTARMSILISVYMFYLGICKYIVCILLYKLLNINKQNN